MATDFPTEISALRSTLGTIRAVTDPDALRARIAKLSEQASVPDLLDDPDAAQQVTSKLSHAQNELERLENLQQRLDDLDTLVEMAMDADESDPEHATALIDAEAELVTLRRDLGSLEVRTLLAGEYDHREAVVSIRSGAGGVDAADFAEMLLRMYLRWAERHGYPTTVLDISYAE